MNFRHRHTNQSHFHGLQCYGRRVSIPKKTILSIYTAIAIAVPVVIPVPLVFVLQKIIPKAIRL